MGSSRDLLPTLKPSTWFLPVKSSPFPDSSPISVLLTPHNLLKTLGVLQKQTSVWEDEHSPQKGYGVYPGWASPR